MELNLELTPEDGGLESAGLSSPMGGKHQRDLSLSAKWASNKALALEYLKRQREAILWIESVLERKLPRDLFEALKSGIVLRELLVKLYPEPTTQCMSPISRRYSLTMAPWKERENITIFLKHCKSMGMNDTFLFCTDDLYEGTNMVQVLFSIQHFMAFSREKSRFLFKPIAEESITFSNQELEMALSKIEQAGVDINALLTSAPSSASPSPAKSQYEEAEVAKGDMPLNASTPSTTSSERDSDAIEAKLEQDPAEDAADDDDNESDDEVEPAEDEESAALQVLELELTASENNNGFDNSEDSYADQHFSAADAREDIDGEDQHDLDAEGQLPDMEAEDDEDLAALQQIVDEEAEAEIFAFAAAELDESILLLEIMEEMINRIENNLVVDTTINDKELCADPQSEQFVFPGDIEVVRLSSVVVTETTDKHDTYVGDSLAPTVADTHAAAEAEAPTNRFARASKKASKAGKKKRESSNEPLDEEAMSKCTCGSKCTIM